MFVWASKTAFKSPGKTHADTAVSLSHIKQEGTTMSEKKIEMTMHIEDLYREEMFTDLRMGSIRKLIPIKADGSDDASRELRFTGQARIMTPGGALPLSFEIEATNIAEAVAGFGEAAEQAVEDTMRELEEMRREAASGIVLPGAGDVSKITGAAGSGLIKP